MFLLSAILCRFHAYYYTTILLVEKQKSNYCEVHPADFGFSALVTILKLRQTLQSPKNLKRFRNEMIYPGEKRTRVYSVT